MILRKKVKRLMILLGIDRKLEDRLPHCLAQFLPLVIRARILNPMLKVYHQEETLQSTLNLRLNYQK